MSPAVVPAQADRIDAGSFSVFQDGQRIGREQFSFRKAPAPDGSAFELRAEATRGDKRTAVQLTTDSIGSPIRYSLEVRDDATVSLRLGGQRVRGRFATLSRATSGESAREYLLLPGTLTVDAEFFHQLALVVKGRPAAVGISFTVPVLSPLHNTQQSWRVALETDIDSVAVAGVMKPSRRWRLIDGDGVMRMVWTDGEGHLLRVAIATLRLEAIRDDIPRP